MPTLITPIPVPPSIDRIYAAILSALTTYAATCRSVAVISRNPEDAMVQVINAKGAKIVLHPERADAINQEIQATVDKHTFRLFLSSNIGIDITGHDNGICQSDYAVPLMRQIDNLRYQVLRWRFDKDIIKSGKIYYEGFDPCYTPDGYPIAAYAITFHFRAPIRANITSADEIPLTITAEVPGEDA